eukprot:2613460-Rhodomonas_salina.1
MPGGLVRRQAHIASLKLSRKAPAPGPNIFMRTRKDDFSLKAIKTEQAENGAVDADTASSVPAVEDASVVQVEEASVEELRKLALEKVSYIRGREGGQWKDGRVVSGETRR